MVADGCPRGLQGDLGGGGGPAPPGTRGADWPRPGGWSLRVGRAGTSLTPAQDEPQCRRSRGGTCSHRPSRTPDTCARAPEGRLAPHAHRTPAMCGLGLLLLAALGLRGE